MSSVDPGSFNRRIAILRATKVTDPGSGQEVESWVEHATVWASWRRASAGERVAAAELSAVVTDVFIAHYTPKTASVLPTDRIEFEGRQYALVEVTEMGFRENIMFRGHARAEAD